MKTQWVQWLLGVLFLALIQVLLSCGQASKAASSVRAERFYGPDGSTCYAIMQGETAVGGNCIPQ
jgi:hypothetical protein